MPLEWSASQQADYSGMQQRVSPGTASNEGTNSRPEFQVVPAFSIPMINAHMRDCEALNRELRDLFVERAAEGERYSNREPRVRRNKSLVREPFRPVRLAR